MKLRRIALHNFRQFRGEQELHFADLDDRNVTLIHAENGFGKTALLNALRWGFYGHAGLTPDFQGKDRIINQSHAASSIPDKDKFVQVDIWFEHEGRKYHLTRSLSYLQEKTDSKKTTLSLEVKRDGETFQERLPEVRIRSIIPPAICPLLFFEGEGPSRFALEENAEEVKEAIQDMLGLSILKAAYEDLRSNKVLGRFRSELRQNASEEVASLIESLEQAESQVAKNKELREQARRNLAATDQEIEAVDASLANNRDAQELHHQRHNFESAKTKAEEEQGSVKEALSKLLADDGYSLFTRDLVQRGRAIVTHLRDEHRIPAQVLNVFVEKLLKNEICICKRCLSVGSDERAAVEKLLTTAGDQNVNNAVAAIDNALGRLEEIADNTRRRMNELNGRRLSLKNDIEYYENSIEEIRRKLGNRGGEEVRELEDKRRKLQDRRDDCIGRIRLLGERIDEAQLEADNLRRQISAAKGTAEAAAIAKRRFEAVEQSAELINRILQVETEDLVPMLNEKIQKHFDRIIDRPHKAELTPSFRFSITEEVGGDGERDTVHQSAGQRQLTALIFIASLVELAEERARIPTIVSGVSGAAYPMVMDSPFGQLSTRFRRGLAEIIPYLAPQVILFASTEQYFGTTDAVAKAMETSNRIGKRYYLAYQGPTLPKDADDHLTINGKSYQLYYLSEDKQTEIKEI